LTYSFRPHHVPGVNSVSIRNEYQEYFLEIKVANKETSKMLHLEHGFVWL